MMYRLAKWAFHKGVLAERSRIKKLIAESRQRDPGTAHKWEHDVWRQTDYELNKLLEPNYNILERQAPAKIDGDDSI